MAITRRFTPLLAIQLCGAILLHIASWTSTTRIEHASTSRHTFLVIVVYAFLIPFIMRSTPTWYTRETMIAILSSKLLVNWLLFYQSAERFSEATVCTFGHCRITARWKAILKHVIDSIPLVLILADNQNTIWSARCILMLGFVVYIVQGARLIVRMTDDGSVSDLRGIPLEEACTVRNTRMDMHWRMSLNDISIILTLIVVWQALYSCRANPKCKSSSMRSSYIKLTAVIKIVSLFVPAFLDQAHLKTIDDLNLPRCFDR